MSLKVLNDSSFTSPVPFLNSSSRQIKLLIVDCLWLERAVLQGAPVSFPSRPSLFRPLLGLRSGRTLSGSMNFQPGAR